MTIYKDDIRTMPTNKRKRIVKLCPAAEKIVASIPPYIGLTGDALRATVERCVKAQRLHDDKDKTNGR